MPWGTQCGLCPLFCCPTQYSIEGDIVQLPSAVCASWAYYSKILPRPHLPLGGLCDGPAAVPASMG